MVDSGVISPTAKDVAARAGVGLRTVFERFADMDDLQLTATGEKLVRVAATFSRVSESGTLEDRIESMTAARVAPYDDVTAVRRAAERQEWYSAPLQALLSGWDNGCALDVFRVFEAEFSAMSAERLLVVGAGAATASSWSYWNQLRQRRSLSAERSASIVGCTVRALLR